MGYIFTLSLNNLNKVTYFSNPYYILVLYTSKRPEVCFRENLQWVNFFILSHHLSTCPFCGHFELYIHIHSPHHSKLNAHTPALVLQN